MKTNGTLADDLRAAGLAATKQRLALLGALRKGKRPASAEVLARGLARAMNETTVYRALDQLIDAGLARRVDLGENHARYEAAGRHHHHLVCRGCAKIEDVSVCLPTGLSSRILSASPSFRSIEDHALEFFGLCKVCDSKKK